MSDHQQDIQQNGVHSPKSAMHKQHAPGFDKSWRNKKMKIYFEK